MVLVFELIRSRSNREMDPRLSEVSQHLRERAGEPNVDGLLTQPFFVSTPWTGIPGVFVPAETALAEAEAFISP
jgi:F0F1-type ATP synthase beta subunit